MQDRITPCIVDGQSCFGDDQMVGRDGLRELVDLGEQLAHGAVHIHDVADRIASLLSRGLPESDDLDEDDEEEDEDEEEDDECAVSSTTACGGGEAGAAPGALGEALLLAGYSDCMREALRFLVEEESYSAHDPLVLGLRQHLLDHQPRLAHSL